MLRAALALHKAAALYDHSYGLFGMTMTEGQGTVPNPTRRRPGTCIASARTFHLGRMARTTKSTPVTPVCGHQSNRRRAQRSFVSNAGIHEGNIQQRVFAPKTTWRRIRCHRAAGHIDQAQSTHMSRDLRSILVCTLALAFVILVALSYRFVVSYRDGNRRTLATIW